MSPSPSTPRPALSISLPPSAPHPAPAAHTPKTPEAHQPPLSAMHPPPPPRPQAFRVRRRRTVLPQDVPEPDSFFPAVADTAIPTIEMCEAGDDLSSPVFQHAPSAGLLSPLPQVQRFITPPKTPASRLQPGFGSPDDSPADEWDLINDTSDRRRRRLGRSASVSSSFSDSSLSSCGSSDFSSPNHCLSPQSDLLDPFLEDGPNGGGGGGGGDNAYLLSPDQHSSPQVKRRKTLDSIIWTPAMDDHLWFVFLSYHGDPRGTPFKEMACALKLPPAGLSERVARKAKRTWSSNRFGTAALAGDRMRAGSPGTTHPEASHRQPRWPRGRVATRRRLKQLYKHRMTSIPIHYQRILETRSPSPLTSSDDAEPSTGAPAPTSFSSRALNVSLAAATAPSMQPEGPLAQLSSDPVTPPRPQTTAPSRRPARPDGWYDRIPRSQAHQKSLSLQSGLHLDDTPEPASGYLASPFDDASNRDHLLHSMTTTKSLGRTAFTVDATVPTLGAPVELSGAPTAPRSLKRRFKSDEEKPRRPAIQDVFGPSPAQQPVIVRNRGFTDGAVRAAATLAPFFPQMPSVSADLEMTEAPGADPPVPQISDLGTRSAPRRLAEPIPRLGSPFTEISTRPFNTFPRVNYVPTAANPRPFQQRLLELAAEHAAATRHQSR